MLCKNVGFSLGKLQAVGSPAFRARDLFLRSGTGDLWGGFGLRVSGSFCWAQNVQFQVLGVGALYAFVIFEFSGGEFRGFWS